MKIKFYDRSLLKKSGNFIMLLGSIISIVALFNANFITKYRIIIIIICVLIIILYYCYHLHAMNKLKKITLNICGSTFVIQEGDIFKSAELKVINFNEYFDTLVDNRIIAKNSLNGKYIISKLNSQTEELDKVIENQLKGKEIENNYQRKIGKTKKYNLGEVVEYDNYLLTSLTRFTKENRAVLTLKDYLSFLMNFWDNLDRIYANRSVAITLFGSSSLTRFTDAYDIREQDLIEIIIWTFKISKIKFKYPTKIIMILPNDLIGKINLYKIKEMYKNGI